MHENPIRRNRTFPHFPASDIVGAAPMLLYHAAGGDDAQVGWSLALGGSALPVASIAHSTAGCVRAR
jgi:hypothetical protein